MNHAILKTEDLKQATGYKQIADVEKCLTKQGIRFFNGKEGPWTTLGERLQSRAYQSAWQRFIKSCIAQGVIEESERFSLHDLKRKGVTDTDQENAAGHRDPRMREVYDLSEPTIKPASD